MNISQLSAFEALSAIEGDAWRHHQKTHQTSPDGFFAHFEAYKRRLKYVIEYPEEKAGKLPLSEFNNVRGILGADGISRYHVEPDGEIVLVGSSIECFPHKRLAARQAGIEISGVLKAVSDE